MGESSIEWTDLTWNPVRGCARVSPGCFNCYAEKTANRFRGKGHPYHGLIRINANGKGVWTGRARAVPELLAKPLSWRGRARRRVESATLAEDYSSSDQVFTAPANLRVFVNSMSDLFHKDVSFEFIAAVYGVMAACPDIDFLVLTKRPERMVEWYEWMAKRGDFTAALWYASKHLHNDANWKRTTGPVPAWPLPNVHVGVSVEDQQRADERIPLLLKVPAAVRWVSAEPLLERVNLFEVGEVDSGPDFGTPYGPGLVVRGVQTPSSPSGPAEWDEDVQPGLDWVVVGGESGPGARPYDLSWPRSLIEQCKAAGVPVFHKQLGSGEHLHAKMRRQPDSDEPKVGWHPYKHIKGADMTEWPADLRVREYPA